MARSTATSFPITVSYSFPAAALASRVRFGCRARGRRLLAALALLAGALAAGPAAARCIPALPVPAADRPAPKRAPGAVPTGRGPALPAGAVELTFLGHASFLIRTHANATAITDYNGVNRAPFAPDIVTMNHAHSTHYTDAVEPGVKYVLRGWARNGVIPRHDVTLRDLRVTNVPTNIRDGLAPDSGLAGNSIFIFESAGLCIVHLGHLHHILRPGHAGRVGSVDVLLAPIDDGYTMPQAAVAKVIDALRPVVVIPMHYGWAGDRLARFAALMKARGFVVRTANSRSVTFTKASLPERQTFLVLEGEGM
jgi:L-ascorbate metabolism protein UlaG (beta-lactamase superfamily)